MYVGMREWQGVCRNAGVAGCMKECGSGRVYVRMRE